MFSHRDIQDIILHAQYKPLDAHSTEDDVLRVLGEPEQKQRRKSELIYFFPCAEAVFSNGKLHQLTIKPEDQSQADLMDLMAKDLKLEMVDEVAPFFRCSRVICATNLLINQSPSDGMRTISIALVFDSPAIEHNISLSIDQEEYQKLQSFSSAKRLSIEELCLQLIKQNIDKL